MNKKVIKSTIIVLVLIVIGLYLFFENNTLEITKYDIDSNKITDEFNGYKIAQISDYHNSRSSMLKKSIIESLNKEKPNIIVITGDFVDSYWTDVNVSIELIEEIKNIAPIYYVTGNHESRIKENYDLLKEKPLENNVTILDDKVELITIGESKINLIGIHDPMFEHKSYLEDKDIVSETIKDIEYDKELFTVLLSHRPELFELYTSNKFDIVLSGHAHGGQIRLPFIGGLVAPNQWLFPKYDGGLYEQDNTRMIVSRGIGNSILPLRINNNPELIYVTLKTK